MRAIKSGAIGLLSALAMLGAVKATAPDLRAMEVAQALSPRCSTPAGICFITPQPIGTPCACGQFQGTVIW